MAGMNPIHNECLRINLKNFKYSFFFKLLIYNFMLHKYKFIVQKFKSDLEIFPKVFSESFSHYNNNALIIIYYYL